MWDERTRTGGRTTGNYRSSEKLKRSQRGSLVRSEWVCMYLCLLCLLHGGRNGQKEKGEGGAWFEVNKRQVSSHVEWPRTTTCSPCTIMTSLASHHAPSRRKKGRKKDISHQTCAKSSAEHSPGTHSLATPSTPSSLPHHPLLLLRPSPGNRTASPADPAFPRSL